MIAKEKDVYVVDSKKLKFNKLLGKGKPKEKFRITVKYASAKAIETVKSAGGEVIIKQKIKKASSDKEAKEEAE